MRMPSRRVLTTEGPPGRRGLPDRDQARSIPVRGSRGGSDERDRIAVAVLLREPVGSKLGARLPGDLGCDTGMHGIQVSTQTTKALVRRHQLRVVEGLHRQALPARRYRPRVADAGDGVEKSDQRIVHVYDTITTLRH